MEEQPIGTAQGLTYLQCEHRKENTDSSDETAVSEEQTIGAAQGLTHRQHEHSKEHTDSSDETAEGDAAEALFSRVEMVKDKVLPHLQPPGEEEADCFYHGICSQPYLVGRASAGVVRYNTIEEQKEAWRRDPVRSAWFLTEKKGLAHIGAHKIRTQWETVEQGVKLAISYLPWTSLDVVRLGDTQKPHSDWPVVVWVGVEHTDIFWPKVAEALRACRLVLDENNLHDVDVQVRESRVFSLASRPSLLRVSRGATQIPLNNVLLPFSTTIGNPISPCAAPTLTGTLGVYISPPEEAGGERDGKGPLPVWAITCRHVGLPNDLNKDNKCFNPSASKDAPLYHFLIPSDKAVAESIQELEFFREEEAATKSSGLDKGWTSFAQAHDTYEKLLAFRDRDARVSGSVFFSPPIAAEQSAIVWTKDYCLLAMDSSKFPEGESITNLVDVRTLLSDRGFAAKLSTAQRINQPDFHFPRDGLVKVQGLISLSEIRSLPGPFENHMQDACLIVMKQGATTGLTFGCPSELMSTTRSCMPDGSKIETREWAVPGSFGNKHVAFSQAGDSGAAVVGLDGRLGGILTRGTGSETGRKVDITYVTPAVLILEDIEKELGHPVVLL